MRKAFILALLVLGAVLTACSRPPDFTISLNPTSLTVQQGSSDTTVNPDHHPPERLRRDGEPGAGGRSQRRNPLPPAASSVTGSGPVSENLTIDVDSTVNAGDYDLQIKATSGNLNKTAPLSLKVTGPTGTETLSGMVVSENAGGPVAGSQVRLMRGGTLVATTTTDAQGAFTFANIPADTYRLEVQKPGMAGSFVEGVRVPEMGFVRIIQKPAFDASASTTPPTLVITQDGSQPLEGGTFTNTIPFRVQVDATKDFVRPMRYIYVALGRTPGSAFLSNTATSSRRIFIEVEDTDNQTLSGTAVAGSGQRQWRAGVPGSGSLRLQQQPEPLHRAHNLREHLRHPEQHRLHPIGRGRYGHNPDRGRGLLQRAETPLNLTVPLGKGQVGDMPLDLSAVPEGSNLYVEVRWCYTATATPFAFDIERSEDGQNWTRVGTVGGARSASCPTNPFNRPFFFRDASPDLTPGQTYYYRVVARGANRAESAPSSTTPLPPFFAPLLSPADETTGVPRTPDFTIGHPQLAAGADGAAYNLVLWDTLTGTRDPWVGVAWQTLGGFLLIVEFGTGPQGNGVPQGEALVYGFPGQHLYRVHRHRRPDRPRQTRYAVPVDLTQEHLHLALQL
jgi:hypothetical protein